MKTAAIEELISHPAQLSTLAHGVDAIRLTDAGHVIAFLMPVGVGHANGKGTSLRDAPPPSSVGALLMPANSRADLLDDFFDRNE